ncbi:MAG: glycosyl hydrolase family 8 [Succinivibrio sp.]|nr:glycosyl hydrolase family 8 [Succinivibrio sp.]
MLQHGKKIMAALGFAAALCSASAAQAGAWDEYKARFLSPEGAVTDSYNNGMSHSEGQSYGLMFALAYNDTAAFEKILGWTETHLADPKTGLHYWAYKPKEADPVADKNNASDGDLLMAWALLKAGKAWKRKDYTQKAEQLAQAIAQNVSVNFAGYQVLLPGLEGFYRNSSVVVNPSYLILPALRDLANATHDKKFADLYSDGKRLLNAIAAMQLKVPLTPDWAELDAQGKVAPASDWPARSSYDAIRVPLYVYWDDPESPLLKPWRAWFSSYPDTKNPAWVNVTTGEVANYPEPDGLKAVRALTLGQPVDEPVIAESDDYYNASLKILAFLAKNRF